PHHYGEAARGDFFRRPRSEEEIDQGRSRLRSRAACRYRKGSGLEPLHPVRLPHLASAALILSGCGYIGDPQYPLLNLPKPVTDLSAVERGKAIVYQFTLPELTTEGVRAKIGRIETRVGEAPQGPFNREQWLANATELQAKPGEHGQVKGEFPAAPWVGKDLIL